MDDEIIDEELQQWETRKAELKKQYPGIAGEYKVFKVTISTQEDLNPKEGEFGAYVSGLIEGWVDENDVQLIYEAVWSQLDELNLPEFGFTDVIAYESGEREDVFWNKYYRIAPAAAIDEKEKP